MLLIADDLNEGARIRNIFRAIQPCILAPLEAARSRPAVHSLIACLVDLRDPVRKAKLAAALSHHRAAQKSPAVILLLPDSDDPAMDIAEIGANEVLPASAEDKVLAFAAKRCLESSCDEAELASKRQTQDEIQDIGRHFGNLFAAAGRRQAVNLKTLTSGADALVSSIKRASLNEWIDVVRRYDDATYQHCLLVAGLTAAFARHLNLAPSVQQCLAQAALVHDIGKAEIPHGVLNKRGPLDEAERDLMKRHPMAGHQMLARQGGLNPIILDVVRSHHEMLDGTGYPDGLSRHQISDAVRVVTICDIFAALIERRVYKPPMSRAEAKTILVGMGRKLDTSLLERFDTVIEDCR